MKTLIHLVTIIILIACNQNAAAQNLIWATQMGGPLFDAGYDIAVDDSGYVYATGGFYGTIDIDPGPGVLNFTALGDGDLFITKQDSSGNLVWARQMGGSCMGDDVGTSVAVDDDGNVYTTGFYCGTVDFDPGPGVYNLPNFGSIFPSDIFVSKLDRNGNFVWAIHMGGTDNENGSSIIVGPANELYLVGTFRGVADFDPGPGSFSMTSAGASDIFIAKIDSSGSLLWAGQMGGAYAEHGSQIALDNSGNIYTTGIFNMVCDFDPGPGTANLTSFSTTFVNDVFVSKLSPTGNFIWAKQLGGVNHEYGAAVTVDNSGNVYTTGYFDGVTDFDPGPGVFNLTPAGNFDIFISKLDASGNFLFAIHFGDTLYDRVGNDIILDANGDLYISGGFGSTVDFDPGPGVFNLSASGMIDIFVASFTSNGNLSWVTSIGGPANQRAFAMTLGNNGQIYATGELNGSADFNPGPGTDSLISFGYNDIFIVKLSNESITGLTDAHEITNNINLHPNPTHDIVYITSKKNMILAAELYNLQGKLVQRFEPNSNSFSVSLHELPGELYFIKLVTDEEMVTRKLIISR